MVIEVVQFDDAEIDERQLLAYLFDVTITQMVVPGSIPKMIRSLLTGCRILQYYAFWWIIHVRMLRVVPNSLLSVLSR